MNWVLFLVLLLLTIVNYLRANRVLLHPCVLACGIFSLSSLLMALNGERWGYDISFLTFIYIFFALFIFSFGESIGERVIVLRETDDETEVVDNNYYYIRKQILFIICVICILVTYKYYQHQYEASVSLGNNFGIAGMILYLRQSTVFDSENEVLQLSTTLNIGLSFVRAISNLCLFLLILKLLKKENDWYHYIIPILCLMANVILSTGRGGFIGIVTTVIFDLYIITRMQNMFSKNKKIMKYAIISVALFGVVFFALGTLTGKDEALNFTDAVSIYAGSGILCLDYMLTNGWEPSAFMGFNTFKGLYGLAGRFIDGIPSLSNHAEMVRWSDYSANIYTTFAPYIRDFGVVGSIIVVFFVGVLFGYLWKRFMEKEELSFLTVIYGGLFGYALCMFPIAERLFSEFIALNVIAQLVILQFFISHFLKRENELV